MYHIFDYYIHINQITINTIVRNIIQACSDQDKISLLVKNKILIQKEVINTVDLVYQIIC